MAIKFNRYTEPAIVAVMLAQEECRLLGWGKLGPGMLLAGLTRRKSLESAQLLSEFGVIYTQISDNLAELLGYGNESIPIEIPLTEETKRILLSAEEMSLQLGHTFVAPAHLLLALLEDPSNDGTKILALLDLPFMKAKRELMNNLRNR